MQTTRAFRVVSTQVNAHGTAVAASRGIVVRWFQANSIAQSWTVPSGTGPITVDLVGGKGGEVGGGSPYETDSGGLGGRVTTTLTGLQGSLSSAGLGSFGIGGTLSVSGSQAIATYTGTFTVTLSYN